MPRDNNSTIGVRCNDGILDWVLFTRLNEGLRFRRIVVWLSICAVALRGRAKFQHVSLELAVVDFVLLTHVCDGILQCSYSSGHIKHQWEQVPLSIARPRQHAHTVRPTWRRLHVRRAAGIVFLRLGRLFPQCCKAERSNFEYVPQQNNEWLLGKFQPL